MKWIERVERRDGAWGVLTSGQPQDGLVWRPANQLSNLTPAASATCRRRLSTNLSEWTNSSARDYLTLLGDKRTPTNGQMVFSFRDAGTEYLVPAIVVIRALFRPLRYIAPWLFHPNSLELVSAPTGDASAFSATIALEAGHLASSEPARLKELFTWVWAYPSARRMWNSLYLRALEGKLGVTLPQGSMRAVFHGIVRGKQVAVTDMRVLLIATSEHSDLEVLPATATFILHGGVAAAPMPKGDAERQLLNSLGGNPRSVTDNEWGEIRDLVAPEHTKSHRQLDQRALVDGILSKLATGIPWRKMRYQTGDWRHASTAYRRWKVQGLWEEVCARLVPTCQPT